MLKWISLAALTESKGSVHESEETELGDMKKENRNLRCFGLGKWHEQWRTKSIRSEESDML